LNEDRKTKVKVWIDANDIKYPEALEELEGYKSLMEEIPKGEKSSI
jgi:hypothetical protein